MPSWGGAAKGAGTGAAIGSFVPVVGTGVGAGLGALLGGVFGGGDKDKAAATPAGTSSTPDGGIDFDQITQALSQSAGTSRAKAGRQGAESEDALRVASDYFKALTGGSNTAVTQARRGMVVDQYDTARKAIAEFGPRGGGSTSASAQSRISQASQIADMEADAQTEGATGLASIGAAEGGLALSSDQLASADLNSLISTVLGQEQIDVAKSGQKSAMTSQLAQGLGLLLGMYLTRKKAA